MSCGSNFQPHTSCRASRLLLPHPPRQRKGPSDLPLGNRERLASARSARGGTRAHRGGSRHQVATERDIRGDAPCCLTTASRCFVPVTTFHEIPGDRRLATSVADEPRDHTRRGQLSVRAPLERLSPAPAWRASATTHTTTAADRAGGSSRASPRQRARGSNGAQSRRGGSVCSRRKRRPCRCAAACRRRNRGTRRHSGP